MFFLDKKLVTISLKYLGGHPELTKPRNLTAYRKGDCICFKEITRPVIPISSIKKITLRNVSRTTNSLTPALFEQKRDKKFKNVLDIVLDYNGLEIHMLFSGNNVTSKYAQFLGLLKGSYKEYEKSECAPV